MSSPPPPALDYAPSTAASPVQAVRDATRVSLRRIARLAARYAQVPCVQIVFFDPAQRLWDTTEGQLGRDVPDALRLYESDLGPADIELRSDLHAHEHWAARALPQARLFAGFVCHGPEGRMAALCLWDSEPRTLPPDRAGFLSELAATIADPVLRYRAEAERYRLESRITGATPDAPALAAPTAQTADEGSPPREDRPPRAWTPAPETPPPVRGRRAFPDAPSEPAQGGARESGAAGARTSVPPKRSEPDGARAASPRAASPLAQPTSVLVVHAAETTRSLVGAYLMGICESHTAATLADALHLAEERPFDLLLLDTGLAADLPDANDAPGTPAYAAALLARLRACAGAAEAQPIALAADPSTRDALQRLGFRAVLGTPLDETEVLLTIGSALAG